MLAVASSASVAASCVTTSSSTTTSTSNPPQQPQPLASPAPTSVASSQAAPSTTSTQQTVVPSQQAQSNSSYVTTTTTTTAHTVRSNYKPIAPAPPQQQQPQQQPSAQPSLIAMTPHPLQQVDKPDQQQQQQQPPQILTIPVGYPIGMAGAHGIRAVGPVMGNFSSLPGDQGGMVQLTSSGPATTCFITSPAMTTVSRMAAPLPGGMITMAAPLSAMANMTQTVTQSAPTIHSLATNGPRMTIPPLQPVTVSVSAAAPVAPQFATPSPVKPLSSSGNGESKADESKDGTTAGTPTSTNQPSAEENKLSNGTAHHGPVENNNIHSPALRGTDRKDPALPQAVVRPQVLTHVLGDFVIQESSEPFPVGRFHSSDPITRCNGHKTPNNDSSKLDGEPPRKAQFLLFLTSPFFCLFVSSLRFLLLFFRERNSRTALPLSFPA